MYRASSYNIHINQQHPKILVIRLYCLLDDLHVSDCISPSSGATLKLYNKMYTQRRLTQQVVLDGAVHILLLTKTQRDVLYENLLKLYIAFDIRRYHTFGCCVAKILVIRLYFLLGALHVSDYISPSSGATL